MQEDIIQSVLNGNDTLAMLPTGGGKSVCFQVPALLKTDLCLVISPLVALMKDQVESLQRKGIQARALVSGMATREILLCLEEARDGGIKFLYISPERLNSPIFRDRAPGLKVSMIAVDEAHCISQWGYDFRPSYLQIAKVREMFPQATLLALTATATPEVRKEITEKLIFNKGFLVFVQGFERPNLSYSVFREENKTGKMITILKKVPGSSVVYVRNRNKTKAVAEELNRNKIHADFYHAGLSGEERSHKQDAWIKGKSRVMVATNAFGMGIDKPDVRTVIHLDLPDSPEAYYQEAGRAGRDGNKSFAVLLFNQTDILLSEERMGQQFPPATLIKKHFSALCSFLGIPIGSGSGSNFDFDIQDFCSTFNFKPSVAYHSIRFLENEGWITLSESVFLPSRINFTCQGEELYRFQVQHPSFDSIVKTILRNTEGAFTQYARIHEKHIAAQLKIPEADVVSKLNSLDRMGIVNYQQASDKPRIHFLRNRIEEKFIEFNNELFHFRKRKAGERLDFMRNYATKKTRCRSQMLLGFLGEKNARRCGVCDFCLERNKLALSDLEFSDVKNKVSELLKKEAFSTEELISHLDGIHEEKALKVIQWLIDNGKISVSPERKLSLP